MYTISEEQMKHLLNIITLTRIPLSISLLFSCHNHPVFIILYLLCGFSDILDGYMARKMNVQSTLGTKLDSIADIFMYGVIITVLIIWERWGLISFIPVLTIICLTRCINIITGYLKFRQLVMIHTLANKISGVLVFLIPILYVMTGNIKTIWPIAIFALLTSLEEAVIIIRMKKPELSRKSLFFN